MCTLTANNQRCLKNARGEEMQRAEEKCFSRGGKQDGKHNETEREERGEL